MEDGGKWEIVDKLFWDTLGIRLKKTQQKTIDTYKYIAQLKHHQEDTD